VLSQITATYQIKFPDLYGEMLSKIESINVPIRFLPFGCTFPDLDNYLFDLVLRTAVPLREPQSTSCLELTHVCAKSISPSQ
jgi:hypothetical protein